MLHEAIWTGQNMELVGNRRPEFPTDSNFSGDMEASLRQTAWGLFHIDTYVSKSSFLVRAGADPAALCTPTSYGPV